MVCRSYSTGNDIPTESSSSCEITAVQGDFAANDEESQNLDVDENSKLVNPEHPQCRICLDTEEGGQQFKYVRNNGIVDNHEGFAFAHCTECRAVFILRANVPPDRWWLRLKFQFLVARDHAFIFIIVQLIVAFLGVMVYKFYGDELREMFGYEEHPYGFYTMAVLAIVLVGLLYGFFIAIICGQRINERHYHVLAKQELTKEYVVEDRENNKNAPELDPSHVTELRMG
ncbi:RING/FYVE/PHD zinc finger superfamily protein [Prunus dulcis]|uniref:RING/FYVE/PHD zinc finger superfamily protein n=1 Tax=Prunus dulcis TaxID=3755 RepID=A0A4Y1R3J1_PRUDU|nr:RING/FYVE/PHD zinc finger superfamily protein [Prunus dulcis]